MAYDNGFKKIHDTPLWIPMSQQRVITSALAGFSPLNGKSHRYIYEYINNIFYKYDTWTDTHLRLQGPNIAAAIKTALRYSSELGSYGNCLSATSTTITTPAYQGLQLDNLEIEIIEGTGRGQVRTITDVSTPIIVDSGTVSAATTATITDTTKRWRINEFVGCQLRIVNATGVSQVKRILYNTETVITIQDSNYSKLETWNNSLFNTQAPFAVPVATAGSASQYFIEKSILTVNSAWTTNPDTSSSYVIKGGGVFLITGQTGAVATNFWYYDCLMDTWTPKSNLGNLFSATLASDVEIALQERSARTYESGTATSGGARTLTNSGASMEVDTYRSYQLAITAGTGMGQYGRIVANDATSFEIAIPWVTAPDATSEYKVYASSNSIWLAGNGASSIYKYKIEEDFWVSGSEIDFGTVRNISCKFAGQEAFGVTSGTRNTGGITVLDATPTAGGTGYNVGDIFNITTGGTSGKGKVTATVAGVVTAVELYASGLTYTTGAGKVTTNILGTGTGLTVNITTVGTVARVTTTMNHNLVKGDQVTFAGCTDATWNAAYTVLATDAVTAFDIVCTAAATMVASNSQSTTVIVDATQNWTINEHAGKLVKVDTFGTSQTSQFRRITSNTATTLTVATFVAPINGLSTYAITQPKAFGRERIFDILAQSSEGVATSGSTTTLVDTGRTWVNNQWANHRIRIIAGTGVGSEFVITSNTATTLTFGVQSFSPDTTTHYEIMTTYGTATAGTTTTLTDTSKNWPVNIFSGKRLVFTAGTGARIEVTITSNTATVLTFGVTTAPDTTTMYTILGPTVRSTNLSLIWPHTFGTIAENHGRYLVCSKGATSTSFDFYNISKDVWDLAIDMSPRTEAFTTGTQYEYDGIDSIYFTVANALDFTYISKLNLTTKEVIPVSQTPFVTGATLGNGQFFSLISSPDGGLFAFYNIHISRLLYRALIQ